MSGIWQVSHAKSLIAIMWCRAVPSTIALYRALNFHNNSGVFG